MQHPHNWELAPPPAEPLPASDWDPGWPQPVPGTWLQQQQQQDSHTPALEGLEHGTAPTQSQPQPRWLPPSADQQGDAPPAPLRQSAALQPLPAPHGLSGSVLEAAGLVDRLASIPAELWEELQLMTGSQPAIQPAHIQQWSGAPAGPAGGGFMALDQLLSEGAADGWLLLPGSSAEQPVPEQPAATQPDSWQLQQTLLPTSLASSVPQAATEQSAAMQPVSPQSLPPAVPASSAQQPVAEQPAATRPGTSQPRQPDLRTPTAAEALQAVEGSAPVARRFARVATKRLMREALVPAPPGARGLEAATAALQVEVKRQRLLGAALRRQMAQMLERHSVLQASSARVGELLGRLERLRRTPKPWAGMSGELLAVVEDLNAARVHGGALTPTRGWQYGARCQQLHLSPEWQQPLAVLALAYGGGSSAAAEERVRLSCGPLAARSLPVSALAHMQAADFDATYCAYAERMRERILTPHGSAEAAAAAAREAGALMAEALLADHAFFVHHPTFYSAADAWAGSPPVAEGTRLSVFQRALDAAAPSREQCRQLWATWDTRTARTEALAAERRALQRRIEAALDALQTAQEGPSYSALLDLVAALRANMDEAAVVNSVAITRTILTFTPVQGATLVAHTFPYMSKAAVYFDHGLIHRD